MPDVLEAIPANVSKSKAAAKPTYRDVGEYLAELEKRHCCCRGGRESVTIEYEALSENVGAWMIGAERPRLRPVVQGDAEKHLDADLRSREIDYDQPNRCAERCEIYVGAI
jgi:hypothetical protein